jgi:hypothetical protein
MITSDPSTWPTESRFRVTRPAMLEPGWGVSVSPNILYNNPTVHGMLVSGVPDVEALKRAGFGAEDAAVLARAVTSGLYQP